MACRRQKRWMACRGRCCQIARRGHNKQLARSGHRGQIAGLGIRGVRQALGSGADGTAWDPWAVGRPLSLAAKACRGARVGCCPVVYVGARCAGGSGADGTALDPLAVGSWHAVVGGGQGVSWDPGGMLPPGFRGRKVRWGFRRGWRAGGVRGGRGCRCPCPQGSRRSLRARPARTR